MLNLFDHYGLCAAFYDEQARRFLLPWGPEAAHVYPSFDNLVFNAQGGHIGWWAQDHLRGLDGGVLLFAQGANLGFPLPTPTAFHGNPPLRLFSRGASTVSRRSKIAHPTSRRSARKRFPGGCKGEKRGSQKTGQKTQKTGQPELALFPIPKKEAERSDPFSRSFQLTRECLTAHPPKQRARLLRVAVATRFARTEELILV